MKWMDVASPRAFSFLFAFFFDRLEMEFFPSNNLARSFFDFIFIFD